MNTLYILTSPSGKIYVGVTQRFTKRIKEHVRAKSVIGDALRKYTLEAFKIRLFKFDTIQEAYTLESLLITDREVKSSWYYNQCIGGKIAFLVGDKSSSKNTIDSLRDRMQTKMLGTDNPMRDPKIKAKVVTHLTHSNPMYDPIHKDTHTKAVTSPDYRHKQSLLSSARMTKDLKLKMSKSSKNASKIQIGLVCYSSIREAAAVTGMDRSTIRYKVKSGNSPEFIKLN